MSEDRKVEDDLRRLKFRVKNKVKGLWRSSDRLEPSTVDNEGPSEQTTPDSQQFQIWSKGLRHLVATFIKMADVAFSPRTGHIVTLSLEGQLRTLEWAGEKCSFKPIWTAWLEGVAFDTIPDSGACKLYPSPSGQEVIVACDMEGMSSFQLWSLAKEAKVNKGILPYICHVTFSPTNEFFAVQCNAGNNTTNLFHVSHGTEVGDVDLYECPCLSFHPVRVAFAARRGFYNEIELWEGLPWTGRLQLTVAQDLYLNWLTLSATKLENIYRRSFGSPQYLDFVRFSTQERLLESERGRIPLPIQDATTDTPDDRWEGLYVLDEWIYQGHERLAWLPTEYRPEGGWDAEIDVRGGTVALATKNNSVLFLGFQLERTPVAERYTRLNTGEL